MLKRLLVTVSAVLTVGGSLPAFAQLPQIRLNALFPPGGCTGTTVRVKVTDSADGDEPAELLFAHPGIRAEPAKDDSGSVIAGTFDVTIESDVPPGYYDVRVRGLFGISNPRVFRVDTLPEVSENEPNNDPGTAQKISIGQIISGQSAAAGDVDHFQFPISAGQTVVIRTEAARIDSVMQPILDVLNENGRRIATARRILDQDAALVVSSDQDQTLTVRIHDAVYAGGGSVLYRMAVDTRPLVDFVWPPVVAAGSAAAVDVYGRHLPAGEPTALQRDGRTLYRQPYVVDTGQPSGPAPGSVPAAATVRTVWWNGVPGNLIRIAVADAGLPVYTDRAPLVTDGRHLTGSFVVAGRFRPRGDAAVIRFSAKKGDVRDIRVISERLGIPTAAVLHVEQIAVDGNGRETVKNLATVTKGSQNPGGNVLPTFTSDAAWKLAVPADGLYQLRVADRFADDRQHPERVFVAEIRDTKTGFELVAFESIPSVDGKTPAGTGAVSLRRGGHCEVPVYVFRQGGHNAPIAVTAEDLPEGVTCVPAVIPPGKPSTLLILRAAADCPETTVPIRIIGTSGDISREAHVATLVHAGTNGLPRTARIAASLILNVMKDVQPFTVTIDTERVVVHQNGQVLLPLTLNRYGGFKGKVDVTFEGQPGNTNIGAVSFAPDATTAVARLYFPAKDSSGPYAGKGPAAPGRYQLVARATAKVSYRRNPWKAERAHARVADLQKQIEQQSQAAAAAEAEAQQAAAQVQAANTKIAEMEKQAAAQQQSVAQLREQLTKAADQQSALFTALRQLQQAQTGIDKSAASSAASAEALTAAAQELQAASQAFREAASEIGERTEQLRKAVVQVAETRRLLSELSARRAASQKKQQQAQAAAAAAKKKQEQLTAEKTQAEQAAKAADEAAKPKDVNVRTVTTPVDLQVFAAAGKITAAVPNGGAVKRGTSVEIPVTITRLNGFQGPVQVTLEAPSGHGLSAAPVDIPADQNQGTVVVAAAPDAAPGDVPHAVLRASTPDFQGRPAAFDIPISVKVTE